ncbi:MAG: hypothetical protein E7222_12880 [Clostridiales bacterium]|nr:hypothetical protein [Clostridiales bacterium]
MSFLEDKRKEHPNTLIMQQQGLFFNAYDEDALIICELTGFKLNFQKNGRPKCGFPANNENTLKTVTDTFKKNHVDFIIYHSKEIVASGNHDKNQYSIFLEAAKAALVTNQDDEEITLSLLPELKFRLSKLCLKYPKYSYEEIVNLVLRKGLDAIDKNNNQEGR